jgi:hypothetical protein
MGPKAECLVIVHRRKIADVEPRRSGFALPDECHQSERKPKIWRMTLDQIVDQSNSSTPCAASDPKSQPAEQPNSGSDDDTSLLTLHLSSKIRVLRPSVEHTAQSGRSRVMATDPCRSLGTSVSDHFSLASRRAFLTASTALAKREALGHSLVAKQSELFSQSIPY